MIHAVCVICGRRQTFQHLDALIDAGWVRSRLQWPRNGTYYFCDKHTAEEIVNWMSANITLGGGK